MKARGSEGEHDRSEKMYRSIVESSVDPIISINKEGMITLFNLAAEKVFGYSKEEVLGKEVGILMPEDYRGLHNAGMKRLLKTGEGRILGKTIEVEGLRKNQERFPIELSVIEHKNKERIYTAVIRDVTVKKALNQRVQKYASELQRLNQLKDLFADIMRHDLQNSVAVIKGMGEIMEDDSSVEQLREDLKVIMNNASKLEKMINDAAKFGQLESEAGLKFEKTDLNAVLSEVINGLRPLLKEKGLKLDFKAEEARIAEVCTVIEDVFLNLLSNAIKYSPENSEIRVGIAEKDENYQISVADQGQGVADKHKKIIFERFKRGGKTGIKGIGLGLAIVKRVVEIHKGRVWVEDNPGGGSVFYVELPKERGK